MDLNKIGSLSCYMKNMKLETKWKQKKKSGDFQSESKKTELQRKNEQFKAQYYKQQEENPEDDTLKAINNKIAAGTKLSATEMRYLQSKNPMLYQKIKNDEKQEKAFEKELKECKTKDEVEKLKFNNVSKAMSAIGAVKSNPNIPEGTKLAVAESEMRKLQKLDKIAAKFVKSGEYSKLPTEAEVQKAEKEISQAMQEQTAEIITAENNSEEIGSDVSENMKINFDSTDNAVSEDKIIVTEAENSVEAQKIKRAKAKKAYIDAENNTGTEPVLVAKSTFSEKQII